MRLPIAGTCVITLASIAVCASAGITHRYSFNDGTANDSVGTANGLAVNGPTFSNGQVVFSPAVNNGTNASPATGQYVDLPNNVVGSSRAFSLEAWFTYRGGNNWQRIADFGQSSAGEILPSDKTTVGYGAVASIMLVPQNPNNQFLGELLITRPGGGPNYLDYTIAPLTISRNVEHHVVFTHDPDAFAERLYVDGVLRGQATALLDASFPTYVNNWLGRSNVQQDPFFNGSINEFRIYDHAMTAAEVAVSNARGPDVPEPASPAFALIAAACLGARRGRRRPAPASTEPTGRAAGA